VVRCPCFHFYPPACQSFVLKWGNYNKKKSNVKSILHVIIIKNNKILKTTVNKYRQNSKSRAQQVNKYIHVTTCTYSYVTILQEDYWP
jgi:hypothetical protein